jgi:hypothetical protein
MKRILLAGVAVAAIAGSTAVYAGHRGDGYGHHHHSRMNLEDRAAFMDARIAAVKAGLRLTPDQEKLWPPLEGAVRDFTKLRMDRAQARMDTRKEDRQNDRRDDRESADRNQPDRNPVERLRERADRMGENAAALKKIAEAADPLYKTLDDGQKRRLSVLTRLEGHGGWHHGMRGGRDMDDVDHGDRGPHHNRGPHRDRDRDGDRGPQRL